METFRDHLMDCLNPSPGVGIDRGEIIATPKFCEGWLCHRTLRPISNQYNEVFALDAPGRRQKTGQILSGKALVSSLVSEMARLIRTTEARKWSPPFKLVIVDNRGCVALSCGVQWDGKVRPSNDFRKLRRSHFPANAFLTDGALCIRSFVSDRPPHRRKHLLLNAFETLSEE